MNPCYRKRVRKVIYKKGRKNQHILQSKKTLVALAIAGNYGFSASSLRFYRKKKIMHWLTFTQVNKN